MEQEFSFHLDYMKWDHFGMTKQLLSALASSKVVLLEYRHVGCLNPSMDIKVAGTQSQMNAFLSTMDSMIRASQSRR